MSETSWSNLEFDSGYFSSDERKWINRIRKLKEQHPKEVEILKQPEENDGCIYARLPVKWLQIKPPRTIELTDEQRAERANRLRKAQESREFSTKEKENSEDA